MTQTEKRQQLSLAAKVLLFDYTNDRELIIFTTLDSEDFYVRSEV